jgi:hypothetical protein
MSTQQTLVTIGEALKLVETITNIVAKARDAGDTHVELSPLQAAFSALDLAEDELDKAIDEAE